MSVPLVLKTRSLVAQAILSISVAGASYSPVFTSDYKCVPPYLV